MVSFPKKNSGSKLLKILTLYALPIPIRQNISNIFDMNGTRRSERGYFSLIDGRDCRPDSRVRQWNIMMVFIDHPGFYLDPDQAFLYLRIIGMPVIFWSSEWWICFRSKPRELKLSMGIIICEGAGLDSSHSEYALQ